MAPSATRRTPTWSHTACGHFDSISSRPTAQTIKIKLVALSHFQTYGLRVCVTRSSNNYGPHQFSEKVIPLFITRLLHARR
ncbi:NAD-dependent epimerase/dehydratase family protein [Streptomyces goshikiensis]|uniref:NAD-dependent epimerase/dehydratase family protein n=1 Tax=Streptomyces goshikiensis TaxID=1942 RepID=UPI0037A4C9D3